LIAEVAFTAEVALVGAVALIAEVAFTAEVALVGAVALIAVPLGRTTV